MPFLKPKFSLCLVLEPCPGCITTVSCLSVAGDLKGSQCKIINEKMFTPMSCLVHCRLSGAGNFSVENGQPVNLWLCQVILMSKGMGIVVIDQQRIYIWD